jgi:4-amino-4-deoxychorismate lyase
VTAVTLINGRAERQIDCADRGFQYGDGVFTTMAVRDGRPVFLSLHLERLRNDCHRLRIPFPGESVLSAEAQQLCRMETSGVLKIQITRGPGDRGYRPMEQADPTRVLSIRPAPVSPTSRSEKGVSARLCRHRLGRNPALAGIKHMNRLEQILARSEWHSELVHEGLMMDGEGALIEGTMSNVFVVLGDRLVTPELAQCGVAGVMRSVVLAIAREDGIPADVRAMGCDELEQAQEVFLTNSLIRIWPVVSLEGRTWPVGPMARYLSRRIEARILSEFESHP